jgi:hypothetical protein
MQPCDRWLWMAVLLSATPGLAKAKSIDAQLARRIDADVAAVMRRNGVPGAALSMSTPGYRPGCPTRRTPPR